MAHRSWLLGSLRKPPPYFSEVFAKPHSTSYRREAPILSRLATFVEMEYVIEIS